MWKLQRQAGQPVPRWRDFEKNRLDSQSHVGVVLKKDRLDSQSYVGVVLKKDRLDSQSHVGVFRREGGRRDTLPEYVRC